jgi:hypothetical protein
MLLKNSSSNAGLSYGIASLYFANLLLAGMFASKVDFDLAGSLDRIFSYLVRKRKILQG